MEKLNLEKQEAFLELLEPVRADLSRFANAMTSNRDDAYDLVSDTILVAYEGFEKIRKKESFKAWLFTVASRLFKRNKWRRRFFGKYDADLAEQIADPEPSPDTNIDVQVLYNALEKLPIKQKEAVILFEISGFSLEEIRELQGGTLSGVKSRLKRARERLAELLDADIDNKDYSENNLSDNKIRNEYLEKKTKFKYEPENVFIINPSKKELTLRV